jgi:hypothetical protein
MMVVKQCPHVLLHDSLADVIVPEIKVQAFLRLLQAICLVCMSPAGTPLLKSPRALTTEDFFIPDGESVTCVAKYRLYVAPTVSIQVR